MTRAHPSHPLHGVTLKALLERLVDADGWPGLASRIDIRCFSNDREHQVPASSWWRSRWARDLVEQVLSDVASTSPTSVCGLLRCCSMHGWMMHHVLGLSVTMFAGPRKEAPPMSTSLKSLAKVCEKQRGISAEAFERHLARKASAAWTMAVVGEDPVARRAMVDTIAKAIGAPVITVDAGKLVGTYIGEHEKNLSRLLKTAEQKGAVLFFDEADALFGKRAEVQDAHDKYGDEAASTIPARVEMRRRWCSSGCARRCRAPKGSVMPSSPRRSRAPSQSRSRPRGGACLAACAK